MEGIRHRNVELNGISMHVAEAGEEASPAVLLVHGFPELWYSWRHQMVALAARGYRAVAPDLRGYGDTDAPSSADSYTVLHLVGDLVALIDSLGQDKVFVVGHDWGAIVSWHLCLFRPDRVKALVNLSVPFSPRNPQSSMVSSLRSLFGEDHYICRFQEPGKAEADLAVMDTASVIRRFLTVCEPHAYKVPADGPLLPPADAEIALPSWLSEEDVEYYAGKFAKTGFTGGLNYYRCLDLNWELTAPWTGAQIKVPTKFVVGDLDLTYHFPGAQKYIHGGGFKSDVPLLDEVVVMEGVSHFINQEKAPEVNGHILDFFSKF